ncbi:MAG TPA: pyridoxamine 5'-phosphate oxidase [Clostridiales bacterium]|nr:MAG: hypothetical protein A2Y18_08620 [Clostridiales bacterium GWD2_32_19]HCC07169.1 pyridoxamine 5'-phosphate oxidase [Clostridiales bacterium]
MIKKEINDLIKQNNYGVLATNYQDFPLSSPVMYYSNDKNEIFIASVGGNKFKNLSTNNNVCLLINTEYEDYFRIKGVQIFGKASVYDRNTEKFNEASKYINDSEALADNNTKIIKISPVKMIYLNSLETGEKRKYEVDVK